MTGPRGRPEGAFLQRLFEAALAAVAPDRCVPPHLPERPAGRTVVVGAGKAAAAMAHAVEQAWDGPLEGLVITRYGHEVPCQRIEVVQAGHPSPDEAGETAARRIFELAQRLETQDLLLGLWSGGGSALLSLPAEGVSLDAVRQVSDALQKAGAPIGPLNAVRKHLSALKGGRLAAAAAPARVVSLYMSDVPGDDLAVVASGPTVPDVSSREEARAVLSDYEIDVPGVVAEHLQDASAETPKPGDPLSDRVENRLIACAQAALEAAADLARREGVTPLLFSDRFEGESREVARWHAAVARQVQVHGQPLPPPAVLLSGGETTVTLRGDGRGGPNTEFALALAQSLDGLPGCAALVADTDGLDGLESDAGAFVFPDTLRRAEAAGTAPGLALANSDSWSFFDQVGDLLHTGPTRINVNDFRAILLHPEK